MQDRIATLHTRNVKQDEEREKRRESPQRCACVRRRGEKDVGMFTATRCGAVLCCAWLGWDPRSSALGAAVDGGVEG